MCSLMECKRADASHTVWDGYGGQAAAALEIPVADSRYAIRNGDRG